MNFVELKHPTKNDFHQTGESKIRYSIKGKNPVILSDIYQEDINIVVWQRTLDENLKNLVSEFVRTNNSFQMSMVVTPKNVFSCINESLGNPTLIDLSKNISKLVDMFCLLFEIKCAGLRLAVIDHGMCPKFHVDRVPCRLVTTYHGEATEWLPHNKVHREKLGLGSKGKSDEQSGLYKSLDDVQRLNCGDVALLKGEEWHQNQNAGLVHRSPLIIAEKPRLLMTLDFGN